MEKLNPEINTTRFVNILDVDFTGYASGQPREFKAHEEKELPVWVAQVIATQLVNKIMQEKHNIKTLADSPLRSSLFAEVLPDMAEEYKVKPLSPEEERKEIEKELEKQAKLMESFQKESKDKDEARDKEIEILKKEIESLKKGKVAKK